MEYILLFLLGWMVVCLPAIVVTAVANNRRRRETSELNDEIVSLSRQLDALERRTRVDATHVQPSAAPAPAVAAMKISTERSTARSFTGYPDCCARAFGSRAASAACFCAASRSRCASVAHTPLPPSQPKPVEVGGILAHSCASAASA